jgi:hypothetical protein
MGRKNNRAYLLGLLSEQEADAVENSYARFPARFEEIQAEEQVLISAYLDRQLERGELVAFQNRYLEVPALLKLVEQARRARPHQPRGRGFAFPVIALVTIAVVAAFAAWTYRDHWLKASVPALLLSPGVVKGAGATPVVPLPASPGAVEIALEIPGERSISAYTVRLSSVDEAGTWRRVLEPGAAVRSVPIPEGQFVTIVVNSVNIPEGDYVAEVLGADGAVVYSYVFHSAPFGKNN